MTGQVGGEQGPREGGAVGAGMAWPTHLRLAETSTTRHLQISSKFCQNPWILHVGSKKDFFLSKTNK